VKKMRRDEDDRFGRERDHQRRFIFRAGSSSIVSSSSSLSIFDRCRLKAGYLKDFALAVTVARSRGPYKSFRIIVDTYGLPNKTVP
jgi:hypothetical protein